MQSFYLLCLLPLLVDCDSSCRNCGKLKKLLVVFGHGEQAPSIIFPTDPNRNYQWPEGLENLTMTGKRQGLEMGNYLRHRYKDYLTFNPDEVFARTSPSWRCVHAIRCVLNGIYNPGDGANCYNETGFTDAPMYTVKPDNYDHLLFREPTCPKYSEFLNREFTSSAHNKTAEQYEGVMEELRNLTGIRDLQYDTIPWIYNTLNVEEANNLTIPSWFYRLKPQMKQMSLNWYELRSKYKEGARFISGFLLHDLIGRMTDGSKNSEKILLYATHTLSVASIMKVLQIYNGILPPYSSAVILEVNSRRLPFNSQDYIDIFYRNSSLVDPYKMPIRGCSDPCSVQDFIRLTKDLVIANPEEACKVP